MPLPVNSSQPLFRPEALAHQRRRLWGELVVIQPLGTRLLTLVLLLIVAGTGAYLATASYARRETVQGFLRPGGGAVDVFGRRGGRVESLWIADGQRVESGQRLLQLRRETRLPESGDLTDLLSRQLERERQGLERERAMLQRRKSEERDALTAELRAVDASIARIELEVHDQRTRLIAMGERRKAVAALERAGHASVEELRRASVAVLEARRGWLELRGRRDAALAERERLVHRGEAERLAAEQALIELDRRGAALDKSRLELAARRAEVLRAPIAGRVRIVQARPGQEVQSQRPLLTIYPEAAPLEAVLIVPSRAIGFVREGQPVQLRYDAFPHQRFGVGQGRVRRVDLAAPSPLSPAHRNQSPSFRVVVDLDRPVVPAYGRDWPLRPGMTLAADIELDRRSLMTWLLDPLLAMRARS